MTVPNSLKVTYTEIAGLQALSPLVTDSLFVQAASASQQSPLDQFISNTNAINLLYLPGNVTLTKELSALILLGYMSAIESYFRAIVREVINVDEHSKKVAHPRAVSFGAALHHNQPMLPEALVEDISFAGKRGIEEVIKEVLGIKGHVPKQLTDILDEYSKICELRHCCVHRFGKLGSNNAIKLGMDSHSQFLEQPFSPGKPALQEILDVLRSVAKVFNNFVFYSVLERSARKAKYQDYFYTWAWSWNYRSDRKRFLSYYKVFATTTDNPPSPAAIDIYNDFRAKSLTP